MISSGEEYCNTLFNAITNLPEISFFSEIDHDNVPDPFGLFGTEMVQFLFDDIIDNPRKGCLYFHTLLVRHICIRLDTYLNVSDSLI